LCACEKQAQYNSTPVIVYDTVSTNQTYPSDTSLSVRFLFEDGEGDVDLVLYKDTRKLVIDPDFDTLKVADIVLKNNIETDVSGIITIRPYNTLPVLSPPTDSFLYFIKLIDKKGNISNQITTDTIVMN
jgi:hypothetical protein